MPHLTRRRDRSARQESWLIHYGDTHVRGIGLSSGNPTESDLWQWRAAVCIRDRVPANSHDVRERASCALQWAPFLSKRTEADFEEWRQEQDWTARKYAAWDHAERCWFDETATFSGGQ